MFNRSWFVVARNNPLDIPKPTQTNQELVEEYLAWKKSYSKSAYRSYRVWVTRFQTFANKPPEKICYTDYATFAEDLQGRHAPRGIEYALNVVHNYLRFFAEQGRLRFPLYLARVPRGYARSHEAVTEDEYQMMVEALQKVRPMPLSTLAMIMLLHDTGMRIGELLALEVDDIEENCSAVIHTEKTVRERRVFWNPATDDILQRFLVERVNHGPTDTEALFASIRSRTGRAYTRRNAERMFARALKVAGITRRLSPHSFRHSFIHRLARLSVPDAIIAQLVGHSTPTTIATYTVLSRPEFEHYAQKQLAFIQNENVPLAA